MRRLRPPVLSCELSGVVYSPVSYGGYDEYKWFYLRHPDAGQQGRTMDDDHQMGESTVCGNDAGETAGAVPPQEIPHSSVLLDHARSEDGDTLLIDYDMPWSEYHPLPTLIIADDTPTQSETFQPGKIVRYNNGVGMVVRLLQYHDEILYAIQAQLCNPMIVYRRYSQLTPCAELHGKAPVFVEKRGTVSRTMAGKTLKV